MRITFVLALVVLNTMIIKATYSEAEEIKVNYVSPLVAYNKYKKNAWLVDAMPVVDYARSHAVGAINLPNDGADDIQKIRVMDMPFAKSDEIVVYCN